MTQQRIVPTTTRRVFFYRTNVTETSDDGPDLFEPATAARLVNGLRFNDGSRYQDIRVDRDLCVWAFPRPAPIKMILGLVRHSDLPQLEEGGNVVPLPLVGQQGLLEQAHIVFFPRGIVGAEFNFYGARVSRLAAYFADKFTLEQLPQVTFDVLLRQDVREELDRFEDLHVFTLRLNREDSDVIRQASRSLFDAFDTTFDQSNAPTVEITLRRRPHTRDPLPRTILRWAQSLAGRAPVMTAADKFKVTGRNRETMQVEELDLLRDQLVSVRRVVKQNPSRRAVASDSMFTEITAAYRELRPQLESAAGLGSA